MGDVLAVGDDGVDGEIEFVGKLPESSRMASSPRETIAEGVTSAALILLSIFFHFLCHWYEHPVFHGGVVVEVVFEVIDESQASCAELVNPDACQHPQETEVCVYHVREFRGCLENVCHMGKYSNSFRFPEQAGPLRPADMLTAARLMKVHTISIFFRRRTGMPSHLRREFLLSKMKMLNLLF